MTLTKEQIDDLMRLRVLTKAEAAEIRRLALLGLERDELAEKIGRAVLSALGNANVRDLRAWAQDLHEDSSGGWSHRGAIFDAIAAALEAP